MFTKQKRNPKFQQKSNSVIFQAFNGPADGSSADVPNQRGAGEPGGVLRPLHPFLGLCSWQALCGRAQLADQPGQAPRVFWPVRQRHRCAGHERPNHTGRSYICFPLGTFLIRQFAGATEILNKDVALCNFSNKKIGYTA